MCVFSLVYAYNIFSSYNPISSKNAPLQVRCCKKHSTPVMYVYFIINKWEYIIFQPTTKIVKLPICIVNSPYIKTLNFEPLVQYAVAFSLNLRMLVYITS